MNEYDKLLEKVGLSHLRDRPDELREAVLKELGVLDAKDSPEELKERLFGLLVKNRKKLEEMKLNFGRLIQEKVLKGIN
jgi:hypothetical protein